MDKWKKNTTHLHISLPYFLPTILPHFLHPPPSGHFSFTLCKSATWRRQKPRSAAKPANSSEKRRSIDPVSFRVLERKMLTSASLLLCFEQVEDLMTSRVNDKDDSFSENPLVEETQLIEVGGVHPFVPISELLASENDHRPFPDYIHRLRDHSVDPLARRNAIAWILKANPDK